MVPLWAVISTVYDPAGVVTLFELELLPPPHPMQTPAITSTQAANPLARTRTDPELLHQAKISKADKQKLPKSMIARTLKRCAVANRNAQRERPSPNTKALFISPIVTVLVPDVEKLAGATEQLSVAGAEQDNITVPENEFSAATVSVLAAEALPVIVTALGLADS